MSNEAVEFSVRVVADNASSLLVRFEGKEYWVPRSEVMDGTEVAGKGDQGMVVLPYWLAQKVGLFDE